MAKAAQDLRANEDQNSERFYMRGKSDGLAKFGAERCASSLVSRPAGVLAIQAVAIRGDRPTVEVHHIICDQFL